MPLVSIDERVVSDLARCLCPHPPEVLEEFASVALDCLVKGEKQKRYNKAAKALNIEAASVRDAVRALGKLLLDWTKARSTESEAQLSLDVEGLNLSKEQQSTLTSVYKRSISKLKDILQGVDVDALPVLRKFDWRMDIEVSSRMKHRSFQPQYLLRFDLGSGERSSQDNKGEDREPQLTSFHCASDYASMNRIQQQLRAARDVIDTSTSQRVSRYLR